MTDDFTKYQALGNDYLVVRPGLLLADFGSEPDPASIREICDRNRGPGSDGLLVGGRSPEGERALRIFNPDGSEAEKGGNGLRIYARHVFESEKTHPKAFSIVTKGGRVEVSILDETGSLIRIDMGEPRFDRASLGLGPSGAEIVDEKVEFGGQKGRLTCVSMGNPHAVLRDLPVDAPTARRIGPLVERAPRFPRRTNVQFMQVLTRDSIKVEIWERGAGYTLTSGSSSCAAASVARRLGLVGDRVKVRMAGGDIDIEFQGNSVLMTGPVEKVYEGVLAPELLRRLRRP